MMVLHKKNCLWAHLCPDDLTHTQVGKLSPK
jgi:hypothetical protein